MNKLAATAQDNPTAVTATFLVLVAGYYSAIKFAAAPDPLSDLLRDAQDGAGVAVALGLSSVAAIAAGFVGVIVVFGLGSDSEVLTQFRIRTGAYMRSNWISVIGSAFTAALGGLVAALLLSASHYMLASLALVVGFGLLAHSMVRTLWLFGTLMKVIAVGDDRMNRRNLTRSLGDIFHRAA